MPLRTQIEHALFWEGFLTEELTTRALENAGDKTSCLKQGGYSIAW